MAIYAVYSYLADTCGNSDIEGPIRYIEAENEEEIEEIYPKGFLSGFIIKKINIETVAWIKIQEQIK